ncbi:SUMF1/EgtB/PvdO family nonheme iron enzyme [Rhizobium leguminosarum bv. viciae]|jgi:formylglycine-generating enzyme|uniref:SUMF1/EgtB/PvdO family nonheme iron enzyme n=2 Tax=Rhizobium/Agrobacterium group TaxID=227290 RepID=A0A4V2LES1_RHILV|nr:MULTISPECIES: formylglycine-generating enzyme family protein [Rhizobium]KAF5882358.1 formylglycine-generating enzyme family protein [Rhizobium sp. PEPV16]MBY3246847.1 formylglycine-generating enzyme family protein [Rhizobium laguerreae]MBY5797253.1 formylglycine-generating enzyme family protein [Rhizobium leguminosarum]NKL96011.1 SUMF1/EgtB/PvdO family nonheme iron enzyme [Rhizobium leguminosarum bv. viciae]NKM47560.1 SUMF1/EgtB/PvdO family nonheme iron enzyme [Rhizobium leguminosarum bv. v
MAFPANPATYLMLTYLIVSESSAFASDRVTLNGFAIDRSEVSIADFADFADDRNFRTEAERAGGGHEWGSGWERRPGWTFRTPFGNAPDNMTEPAVHVSWPEARDYCASAGGRLPTRAEWELAAYHEHGGGENFLVDRTYPYPTGETPDGANINENDPWPRHAPARATRAGVNGLYDMGGNVWEWLSEREGANALTAGGSWWYGPDKMRRQAMQWKPADFYVVYIGFRCAYDLAR